MLDEAVIQVTYVKDQLLAEGQFSDRLKGVAEGDTEQRFTHLGAICSFFFTQPQFVDLIDVINQIPVHELGHKNLVQAVFLTRRMLINYDKTLAWLNVEVDKMEVNKNACLARVGNSSRSTVSLITGARDDFKKCVEAMTAL